MKKPYKLFAAKGGGSMIVEAAFLFTELPIETKYLDWSDLGWESKSLAKINPLGQVPTLVLPDGKILTESAAIILHLNDVAANFTLVPAVNSKQRAEFLRWLIFLVSALYPTFTYGDVPMRWVQSSKEKGAGKLLRQSTDDHRKELLLYLEGFASKPWFQGKSMTALDLYIWILAAWRPGQDWLQKNCPKLHAIAAKAAKHPNCRIVAQRNAS